MRALKFSATDLNQLQRQLASWRQSQLGYSRLPQELWAAASSLARQLGVSCVAQTLGLAYTKLKELSQSTSMPSGSSAPPGFVEVQLGELSGGSGAVCRVELSDRAGRKMNLQLPADSPAVLGLVQAFWRGEQ